MMRTPLENFSRDYLLAPTVEVNTHSEDRAVLDADVYEALVQTLGEPIIGFTGGLHYQFAPSREVLAERAAVPKRNHGGHDRMSLLLAK